jgi:hypothetical protein
MLRSVARRRYDYRQARASPDAKRTAVALAMDSTLGLQAENFAALKPQS